MRNSLRHVHSVRVQVLVVVTAAAFLTACATVETGVQTSGEQRPYIATFLQNTAPNPNLSPREVVEYQLRALRLDSSAGFEVAFRFASPANRAVTGPVERFAGMVRAGAYAAMLNYDRVAYLPAALGDDMAIQRVVLFVGEAQYVYDFYLRRQVEEGPYQFCWMTEGVYGVGVLEPPSAGTAI